LPKQSSYTANFDFFLFNTIVFHLEESKQDVEAIIVIVVAAGVGSRPGGKMSGYIFYRALVIT
jgi:hypothetical protein